MNKVVIIKEYSNKETVEVLETVLFTKVVEQSIGKSTITNLETPIRFIEFAWGLNITRNNQFRTVKRILINSVKFN